ncbi:hypothetical protein SLE2022_090090 [Rubroshorea leprosula]
MSLSFLSRFFSLPIYPKTQYFSTLRSTTASAAEKFYARLQENHGNVEKILASVNFKLDSTCISEVLHRCSQNQSLLGIRFFIWAGIQSNYRHSAYMYSKACELLKIKQNPGVLLDVIEAYKMEKCLVSVKTFKVVLNLCKEANFANEAMWVLRKIPEFNIRADTTAYNMVIRLFCEKGDMDMAEKLMGEMGLVDLFPDMITFVSMIKGFCTVGKLEDASRLFKVMREHGCLPNAVAYSTLLEGFCRFQSVERALELLGEMEKEGGNCSPNVITYTSVIQRFCERGKTMEALGILDRMEACGCAPNRVTVGTLIKGLSAEGLFEEAYKLIDRLVAVGSVSAGDCYSSLVLSLIANKRLIEAEKLFWKMLVSGIKPDSLACSIMIKEVCLEGRVLDGFYLYEEIEKMGFLSSIDSDIYSILLVGLCQKGHSVEAEKLARLMVERGIQLKAPYTNRIVENLKKFGDKELVIQLANGGR